MHRTARMMPSVGGPPPKRRKTIIGIVKRPPAQPLDATPPPLPAPAAAPPEPSPCTGEEGFHILDLLMAQLQHSPTLLDSAALKAIRTVDKVFRAVVNTCGHLGRVLMPDLAGQPPAAAIAAAHSNITGNPAAHAAGALEVRFRYDHNPGALQATHDFMRAYATALSSSDISGIVMRNGGRQGILLDAPFVATLTQLVQAVAAGAGGTLQQLVFPSRWIFPPEAVQPMLTFSGLRRLEINFHPTYAADVDDEVPTWPIELFGTPYAPPPAQLQQLEVLSLRVHATLNQIATINQVLPQLHTLSVWSISYPTTDDLDALDALDAVNACTAAAGQASAQSAAGQGADASSTSGAGGTGQAAAAEQQPKLHTLALFGVDPSTPWPPPPDTGSSSYTQLAGMLLSVIDEETFYQYIITTAQCALLMRLLPKLTRLVGVFIFLHADMRVVEDEQGERVQLLEDMAAVKRRLSAPPGGSAGADVIYCIDAHPSFFESGVDTLMHVHTFMSTHLTFFNFPALHTLILPMTCLPASSSTEASSTEAVLSSMHSLTPSLKRLVLVDPSRRGPDPALFARALSAFDELTIVLAMPAPNPWSATESQVLVRMLNSQMKHRGCCCVFTLALAMFAD